MGSLLNCFAAFDQFAINFLKAKQLKTFPGGIFSIIVTIINLGVLAGCLVFYFFQSSKVSINTQSVQFNSDIPTFTPRDSTFNISLSQYKSKMEQSQIEFIYSYFKVVMFSRSNNDIKVNLIRPAIMDGTIQFTIPNSTLDFNITEVNFPRVAFESCATLQSILNSAYFKFNEDDIVEIQSCNSNLNDFYDNSYIQNKIFLFKLITLHHQITQNFELKSNMKTFSYPFSFQHGTHEVFVTERKKIAVLFDNSLFTTNKVYDFYTNWITPSKATIQHFSENFDLQLIVSEKNKYEIICQV